MGWGSCLVRFCDLLCSQFGVLMQDARTTLTWYYAEPAPLSSPLPGLYPVCVDPHSARRVSRDAVRRPRRQPRPRQPISARQTSDVITNMKYVNEARSGRPRKVQQVRGRYILVYPSIPLLLPTVWCVIRKMYKNRDHGPVTMGRGAAGGVYPYEKGGWKMVWPC